MIAIAHWLWTRCVDALIAHALKHPYFHLDGYMERYWVIKPRRWFPWSVRVHHILRSDLDRHLHDHPWPWASLILRNGYYEETPAPLSAGTDHEIRWHGEASFRRAAATSRHRLIIPAGRTTWTLFLTGRRVQTWGFYTEDGKVPWFEYLPPAEAAMQRAEHLRFGLTE